MPRRSDYTYPTANGRGNQSGPSLLLTRAGICDFGPWSDDGRHLGWTRLPKRCQDKDDAIQSRRSQHQWRLAA